MAQQLRRVFRMMSRRGPGGTSPEAPVQRVHPVARGKHGQVHFQRRFQQIADRPRIMVRYQQTAGSTQSFGCRHRRRNYANATASLFNRSQ